MTRRWSASIAIALALGTALPLAAAPAKKPPPKAATKSKPPAKPAPKPVVVEPAKRGGFMVPKAVTLRQTTPAEARANAVWNVRAALNVAALQCQFSPYLATVKHYNDFLKHHSDELVAAQTVLLGHFRRFDGARAANSFDQYTTRTYNSYSTLDAQYRFCAAAGHAGREVLALRKGELAARAERINPEIRAALADLPLSPALSVSLTAPLPVPVIVAPEA